MRPRPRVDGDDPRRRACRASLRGRRSRRRRRRSRPRRRASSARAAARSATTRPRAGREREDGVARRAVASEPPAITSRPPRPRPPRSGAANGRCATTRAGGPAARRRSCRASGSRCSRRRRRRCRRSRPPTDRSSAPAAARRPSPGPPRAGTRRICVALRVDAGAAAEEVDVAPEPDRGRVVQRRRQLPRGAVAASASRCGCPCARCRPRSGRRAASRGHRRAQPPQRPAPAPPAAPSLVRRGECCAASAQLCGVAPAAVEVFGDVAACELPPLVATIAATATAVAQPNTTKSANTRRRRRARLRSTRVRGVCTRLPRPRNRHDRVCEPSGGRLSQSSCRQLDDERRARAERVVLPADDAPRLPRQACETEADETGEPALDRDVPAGFVDDVMC